MSGLGCKNRSRCTTEADCEAVVRIHQADGHGQIGQFLLIEDVAGRLELDIRNAGLRYAGYGFRPGKGRPLPITEQIGGLLPYLHKRQLLDLDPLLDEVAGVHVQAVGTSIDLANAQVDQIDQDFIEPGLHDVAVDTAEGFHAARRGFRVIESFGNRIFRSFQNSY
jgi:hypothetical protein